MITLLANAKLPADYFNGLAVGLLLVRVILGITLAAHGYNKFFGGGRIPGTAGWFDSIGMKPGKVHALAAASTELGSGVLLALGLLTPVAAAGFVGVMVVAAWTVHRKSGFFIVKSGWEYNLILATAAVGIATTSPGRISLDWKLGLDFAFKPNVAFAIAAGLGIVGGIAQLAIFFRPPAENAEGSS